MAGLPIADFIKARLKEFDAAFELRAGTAFEQLFLKPMSFILQPLRSEADDVQISQSALRIMNTGAPDAFDEEAVDSIASNVFVYRVTGGLAAGIVRVYYSQAVAREWPAGGASFQGAAGQIYSNVVPFAMSAVQMSAQIDNGLYYLDIPVVASANGPDFNVAAGGIVSIIGDSAAVSVTNLQEIAGGVPRETNTQLINRTKKSIAVRDLVTSKGINAILFETFPTAITELVPIGFGDKEMMRDIVYNTHIGGKVDVYIKTPAIKTTSKDFVGLLVDPTRQTRALVVVQVYGTYKSSLRNPGVDRTGDLNPRITQVKPAVSAAYTSPVDLSIPVDLSSGSADGRWISIEIDGYSPRDVKLSGAIPTQTKKAEVVSAINKAFGVNIAFAVGNTIKVVSLSRGLTSRVVFSDPGGAHLSAMTSVFGLAEGSAHTFEGDGPIAFIENVHYDIDDSDGTINRIIGAPIVSDQTSGVLSPGQAFFEEDPHTDGAFVQVEVNDILTIPSVDVNNPHPAAGDYRILSVVTVHKLLLDKVIPLTGYGSYDLLATPYSIRRTGIKDGEIVSAEYWFNPLSVDIGKYIPQDDLARVRSLRPGRESSTITDTAFLRINRVELIDPLTGEPLGQDLQGIGGYGSGGYGKGPYGIGSKKDYYMRVNTPSARYSAFEDSYIVINSAYQGFSFRVHYDYAPEVESVHAFARSANERVLDGDILVKHFIPAYVNGTIEYSVDAAASFGIPDNTELLAMLKEFISTRIAGSILGYSEITQFIIRKTDPYDRYSTFVEPFTLKATIYNTDGSTNILGGLDRLQVYAPDPFPRETNSPISPRIVHWVADNLNLVRLD